MFSVKTRAWIYRVLGAASLVVAFYGLATEDEIALWVGVVNAILGNGLASFNTPTNGSSARGLDDYGSH